MRTIYSSLFSIDLRHGYYAAGRPGQDLVLVPTPETARLLRERAFVCRATDHGVAVYAEVTSADPLPSLRRPVGAGGIRFAFALLARSPYIGSVTDLPNIRPGRQLFAFDNLSEDVTDGELHLGDSVAGTRVGSPLVLETGSTLLQEFDPPIASTNVQCVDRFGAQMFSVEIESPGPAEPLTEARIEDWDRLAPGRYTVSDDSGASVGRYKGPGIERGSPLGVVEIFDRTDGMAPDGIDRVPAAYRFLTGDQVTPVSYVLQLEPKATIWKYVVVNKFRPEELNVNDLEIQSTPASFTFTRQIQGDRAVFISDETRVVKQKPAALMLKGVIDGSLKSLVGLPSPVDSSPLEAGTSLDELVSTLYVYV